MSKRASFAIVAVLFAANAFAQTVTVTTLRDHSDFAGNKQIADLPGPDGHVSLDEAVTATNNTPGPQTIAFAIPPETFGNLIPGMGLLWQEGSTFIVTDAGTTIDFSTQTTNMGDTNPNGPELGILSAPATNGGAIYLTSTDGVVKGLGYVLYRGYGVQITGNRNRVIGSAIRGPLHAGICIKGYDAARPASNNIIGGTEPGEGNTLDMPMRIDGAAENNIVIGNPGLEGGVEIRGVTSMGLLARNNRIGGPSIAERNVIAGRGYFGEEGFPVGAQVTVQDADATIIEGNFIGTTPDGMQPHPIQYGPIGVLVTSGRDTIIRNNLIAGLRVVGRNHYSDQVFGKAISLDATNRSIQNTRIEGNTIGLAADYITPIPTYSGVSVSPTSSSYAAYATRIASNHIAGTETTGVFVGRQTEVTITENSIHDNGQLGIDRATEVQSFPVVQSAETNGSSITITGSLDTSRSQDFRIEFFSNAQCDPSGFGEGAIFLGATNVSTGGAGHADFNVTLPGRVLPGEVITATATNLGTGDTSEFSACLAATAMTTMARTTDITLASFNTISERASIAAQAFIRDPSGQPLANVVVSATWTLPDGKSVPVHAATNARGAATFRTEAGLGTYTLTINGATRAGYTFDAQNSVLSKTFTTSTNPKHH